MTRPEATAATVDVVIVIPVYNAPGDVARCVESVLAHTEGPYRLVLIDDASTDPGVGELFAKIAARGLPQVTLLANEHNLGFTGTANRGMTSSRADVVLLNSDTIVTSGWLDALRRCARSSPHIGTVTPFSNNAEICSFPRFCEDNPWPEGRDPEPVRRALAATAVPTYPELPTGVGFCMYVRRNLLDAVGPFDPAFGAGYGEENDFCMRGYAVGYRNVLADDAFVVHVGARSFEGRKEALGARNLQLLLARHPDYEERVRGFIAADPLRPLREAARTELAIATESRRGVLHVIHHHGGGTETHVRALIAATRHRWRHYLVIAVGDEWQVEDHRLDREVATFTFVREPAETWGTFLRGIAGTFAVDLLHLHNISGSRAGLLEAVAAAGLPYGYTVHDLSFACPTITFLDATGMYCGARADCRNCVACSTHPLGGEQDVDAWRAENGRLLAAAAFTVAPSHWAAETLVRYFPCCKPALIPHGTPEPDHPRTRGARLCVALPDDDVPTVAVLGAIGPDKGARRLERLVELARALDARVRFVLIGYLDVLQQPWQSDDARLTVHGRYDPADLPDLLAHYRVALTLYPSAGPETFAYTLSETWRSGRPALVPPIGALAERVGESRAGWVMTEAEWRDEARMLDRILALFAPSFAAEFAAACDRAARLRLPSLATMADATLALYDAAVPATSAAASRADRFPPQRVRDALGYRLWWPPPPRAAVLPGERPGEARTIAETNASSESMAPVLTAFARTAMRLRHTWLGRVAYRLAPEPVLDALKARLR